MVKYKLLSNVFRINTKASDNFKNQKKKKKIVFLDGNYRHPEILSRFLKRKTN